MSLRIGWRCIRAKLFFIFAIGLALLSGGPSSRAQSNPKTSTVNIGVILPLTGGAAALGKASQKGIELAISEYEMGRANDEPLIKLFVEDDRAEPATSVSAFQKLIAANRVRLIIGPLTSGTTIAVAPLANRNHVVILSPGASAPTITDAGDYVFRDELSEALGAKAQAELGFNQLRYRKIGLLYVNNDYGVGTAQVFQRRFTELGGQISSQEAFAPNTTDFRTALLRIKGSHPDAIFVVFQDSIVNIVKQHAELQIKVPIYTTPVFEDPENLKTLGSLADGIVYTYYGTFNATDASSDSQQFSRAYSRRFGEAPTYYAALGYDAARLMIHALRASSFDVNTVKDQLYQIRDFRGVTGTISFDRNGDVIKPVTLKAVRGGQFVAY